MRYQSGNFGIQENSIPFLLGEADYFDYYRVERYRVGVSYLFSALELELRAGAKSEKHASLDKTTDYNLLRRDVEHRPNPEVDEGRLRAVDIKLIFGGAPLRMGKAAARRVEASIEHSPGWLEGDFDFTQYGIVIDWRFSTSRASKPSELDLRLAASTFTGDLPVQRFGALDVRVWRLTQYGGFKTLRGRPYEGDRHIALFWEQGRGGRS